MTSTEELLNELSNRAQENPPLGSRPLSICGVRCGTLVPRSYDILRSPAFYSVFEETEDGLEIPFSGETASRELVSIAKELHDIGAFFQWRDERLDIVSYDTGRKLATAERGLFRFLGMTTTCVHAVTCDEDGRFWLGLRSHTKQVDPDLWDTISGGLSSAGESPLETLARETVEEAGIAPQNYTVGTPIEFLVTRPVKEGWMREKNTIYPITLKSGVTPKNQDGEVARFEAVDRDELLTRIAKGQLTLDAALAFLKTFF